MIGECAICRNMCERLWVPNYAQAFIKCVGCGQFLISDEVELALRLAHSGIGRLAMRLTDIARCAKFGSLQQLLTLDQVVADLEDFLEGETCPTDSRR